MFEPESVGMWKLLCKIDKMFLDNERKTVYCTSQIRGETRWRDYALGFRQFPN